MEHRFFKLAVSTVALSLALSGAVFAESQTVTDKTSDATAAVTQTEQKRVSAPAVISLRSRADGVRVKWEKVKGASAYRVYRSEGDSERVEVVTTADTAYNDKKAKSGKTYTYSVRCLDAEGNLISKYGSVKKIKHVKTPVITGFKNKKNGTQITWEKSKGASAYAVYYLDSNKKWKKLGTTKNTTYTHSGLKSGKTYTYRVRCLDSKGKATGGYDSQGTVNLFLASPEISSVKNLSSSVKLQWEKRKGASAYAVYRKTGDSGWKRIGTAEGTSYTDKTVRSGKIYTYRVRCLDSQGKAVSAGISGEKIKFIKTPSVKKLVNTQTGTEITWEKSKGASAYAVYYLDSNKKWKKLGTTEKTAYTHDNLKSGKSYKYRIRCLDSKGRTVGGADNGKTNVFIAPLKITGLTETEAGSRIKWKSVSTAEGYRVYRKTWGGKWKKLADVMKDTSYTDSSAEADKVYSYAVRCLGKDGNPVSAYPEKTVYYVGAKVADGKIKIDGKKYTFDDGYFCSGLQVKDGEARYYDTDGKLMKNGIVGSDKDGRYYADKKGVINLNYVNGIEYKGEKWIVINGKAERVDDKSDEVLFRAAKEVAKATDTTMTKEEKLKACFDYSKKAYDECRPRTPHYKGKDWPILYANDMFVDGAGNCFSYAAAFAYMAKAIGYERVYCCNSGGHGWAEVDGLIYDPEWSKHNNAHTYFGLDYDRVKDPDYKGGISAGEPWMHVEVK